MSTSGDEYMVIDFADADADDNWVIINDGVMGGISQSRFIASDSGTAFFEGTVSLENNGGFASVRTKLRSYELDRASGLVLRVCGDGKTYQLRVRTDNRFDGVSYRYRFTTETDKWMTIYIPFEDFVPVFRGRILKNVDPILPAQVRQIGFLISEKQAGKFRLEIKWIKAYIIS